jgi:ATP-dependent Clp protease ATP-binding subunit ClpC
VEIDEPSREDAFLILSHLAPRLAAHHQVSYDDEALALSIAWSLRYLPGRCLPDKAVGILDLSGARTRRRNLGHVDAEAVAQVVATQANMPVERLLESDADRMLSLDQLLCERVIGHEEHMHKVARILRRNAAGLGGRRPIGTFLLLGPTGVGKTETAKAIAEALFHSESAMTRIDMAELSEAHAVAKLVGAPPGYVGHDAGGQLTEAVRQRPYQVVLLDEIEKAHPEVLTAFLAVFDEGRMTDSRGRLVDFTNTVMILTSNIGSSEVSGPAKKRVGFSSEDSPRTDVQKAVENAAKRALPPELYNRIDEVLPFSALCRDDLRRIGRKLCQGLSDEVELSRGLVLQISDSAIDVLLDEGGFQPEYGARPLRRMLARMIEAPLSEAILTGELSAGDTWRICGDGGELRFSIVQGAQIGAAE